MFILLFGIPCITVVFAFLLRQAAGPFWLCTNLDPSYPYLINGLYIVKGISPGHTDHPGTPLQLLFSLVDRISNLGCTSADIVQKVLTVPEFYLHVVHGILVLLIGSTSFLLALYVYRKTKDILGALIAQVPSLWFIWFMPVAANVSPEPFLISITNLYSLCLIKLFFDRPLQETISALLLGLVGGLGLAVKINFLPLLFIPIILLRFKDKLLFVLVVVISFVLWTLPIISRYDEMFAWFVTLATHPGIHGKGAAGLLDLRDYLAQSKDIVKSYPLFVLIFGGIVFASIYDGLRNTLTRGLWFLIVMAGGITLQFLLAAKYPARYYLVPGLAACGGLFFFVYLRWFAAGCIRQRLVLAMIAASVVAAMFFGWGSQVTLGTKAQEIQKFNEFVHSKYAGCLFVNYFRSSSPEMALYIGDSCLKDPGVGPELALLYPRSFFFDRYSGLIKQFKKPVLAEDILRDYRCIIFQGEEEVDLRKSFDGIRLLEKGKFESYHMFTGKPDRRG